MTYTNLEAGKNVGADRRALAAHLEEIEAIRSGELGVDWIEGNSIGAAGFTVTDDGYFIGPDDRVWKVVRGQRNLARVDAGTARISILDGDRLVGWLVALSANELQEQNAQQTRSELQARQFEVWEAATTKTIQKAKKAAVIPPKADKTGRRFGERISGSVARTERISTEYGLQVKAAAKDGPLLVFAGSPKADHEKHGAPGVRRIEGIQGAAGNLYYELEKLGRAWKALCDIPKCSSPAETLRAGIVLCEEHAE